jgi:aminopeptidase N
MNSSVTNPCVSPLLSPSRREFLRLGGLVLFAPSLLIGCGGDNGGAGRLGDTCAQEDSEASDDPTVYLSDYQPPAYFVDEVHLTLDLDKGFTTVTSRLRVHRNPDVPVQPFILMGRELNTLFLAIDGQPVRLSGCDSHSTRLTIPAVPESFLAEIIVRIYPDANTSLAGLYRAQDGYFSQCEAEDFRRITWFPDRPDVMSLYTVTLLADAGTLPVLLSNGNLIGKGTLANGRHWTRWHDPFRKPCYLFAAVAADLEVLRDEFVTLSGRTLQLAVYVEPGKLAQSGHAMLALKKAMRWDEERFGLECDLDQYAIVAVGDFNMGAMENKGLNIFNTRYVLADVGTATDTDFMNIDSVVAHEYFHNWTGNRVTCRDWFQLSLKEGLTVFREQEFSADVHDVAVARIKTVRGLRARQFPEDAGPMAHPVRPSSYIAIDNFYTATVYNKGAELVRMMQTLIGPEAFRRGMAEYFRRYDGQAVTVEDFVSAMSAVSGFDFSQFMGWYEQAGTPRVAVTDYFDAQQGTYTLTMTQTNPLARSGAPYLIPMRVALFASNGQLVPGTTQTLLLGDSRQAFHFSGVSAPPVPSLLRDFSAPIILDYAYSAAQLTHLLNYETDPFAAWEASQRLAATLILDATAMMAKGLPPQWPASYFEVVRELLRQQAERGAALVAECLTLPSEATLTEALETLDPEVLHGARIALRREVAGRLEGELALTYDLLAPTGPYNLDAREIGRRALRNLCLGYLLERETDAVYRLAGRQFSTADNMTNQYAALATLVDHDCPERITALEDFHEQWRAEALVMDKWFAVQAGSRLPSTLSRVKALSQHPDFDVENPNRVIALLGTFGANLARFHAADGAGYVFLGEWIVRLDAINASLAAYLAKSFEPWRKYDAQHQAKCRPVLEELRAKPGLSRNVLEVVTRLLG